MTHLLARHAFPHVNIALVVAVIWIGLAVASAVIDIARIVQTW